MINLTADNKCFLKALTFVNDQSNITTFSNIDKCSDNGFVLNIQPSHSLTLSTTFHFQIW